VTFVFKDEKAAFFKHLAYAGGFWAWQRSGVSPY